MAGPVSKPVELVFTRDNTRRYVIWKGEIDGQPIVTHGFGALFPERYLPSRSAETSIWHCPVRTCGQAYATPPDLGDHFVRFHARAILHDHVDGTFSVLPQDLETAYDANCQPYVASQGHMLPSPSLRQPSHSVPVHPEPGASDTPVVADNRHEKSKPQTGNKPTSSSSEVNSDDESDRRSGSDSDGRDNTDASDRCDNDSDGSDCDESDGNDGNKSEASDDAFCLAMYSQHLNQKKRKADNDQIAPEPKKVKTVSVPAKKDSITTIKGKHELRRYRISNSRQEPAIWEQKWGRLSRSGPKQDFKHASLAYSASSVATSKGCVITDDGTSMLIHRVKGTNDYTIDTQKHGTVNDMICTVRDAIITVKITGEEPFTIFPEGCWHIQAGQVCTIRNRYRDAEATVQIYARPVKIKEN
ncbi:hypothetical protein B0T13DRAFT_535347 [Neurospora crassa]|nr:hypothetical protein B0T13DRAFT_506688 [Neurospora crassa]KAK3502093.1 hypothetical protein B0T13DRAFT_535347 [Neurospora crassa]